MNKVPTDGASIDMIERVIAAGHDKLMWCHGKPTNSQQVPIALGSHLILDV